MLRISSPLESPAAAAGEPSTTLSTTAFTWLTPFAQKMAQSTRMANRMLAAGPGEQHEDALPRRPAGECARQVFGRYRAVAFIEHAHVTAERQRGDDELRVIRRGADSLVERLAEAHRRNAAP
jgi:hypothetical protein